jgi:hypothetical protein
VQKNIQVRQQYQQRIQAAQDLVKKNMQNLQLLQQEERQMIERLQMRTKKMEKIWADAPEKRSLLPPRFISSPIRPVLSKFGDGVTEPNFPSTKNM